MRCAAPEKHTDCKLAKKFSNCFEAHSATTYSKLPGAYHQIAAEMSGE